MTYHHIVDWTRVDMDQEFELRIMERVYQRN